MQIILQRLQNYFSENIGLNSTYYRILAIYACMAGFKDFHVVVKIYKTFSSI